MWMLRPSHISSLPRWSSRRMIRHYLTWENHRTQASRPFKLPSAESANSRKAYTHTKPAVQTPYHPVFKGMAYPHAPSLALIYQASLDQGRVPDDWKKANMMSIFRKEDKSKASNNRPVFFPSHHKQQPDGFLRPP